MRLPTIRSEADIANLVEELGFLPFFRNEIEGFSIEEACDPSLWFSAQPGPWEWKGPVIRHTRCAYGKFYAGRALYIAERFFPDFANWRRDGYDYDARVDDDKARNRDRKIMEVLAKTPSLLSKELKKQSCLSPESKKQFDGCLTFLQMQAYILTEDFEYMQDKTGKEYGWGVARYTTPEAFFGPTFTEKAYAKSPDASRKELEAYLHTLCPEATQKDIDRLLG